MINMIKSYTYSLTSFPEFCSNDLWLFQKYSGNGFHADVALYDSPSQSSVNWLKAVIKFSFNSFGWTLLIMFLAQANAHSVLLSYSVQSFARQA